MGDIFWDEVQATSGNSVVQGSLYSHNFPAIFKSIIVNTDSKAKETAIFL